MYGMGLLQGLLVTLRNFFRPPITVQYPDRKVGLPGAARQAGMNPVRFLLTRPVDGLKALAGLWSIETRAVQSSRFRGQDFNWYEERCTGCASCAKYCPLGIIKIVTHPGGIDVQEGESYAIDVFDIDIGRCCVCGLCVEACPYDALHLGNGFETARYRRDELVFSREDLVRKPKRPSTWFRPQHEEKGYHPHREAMEDWRRAGRHQRPSPEDLTERWVERR